MDFNRKLFTIGNELKINITESGDIATIMADNVRVNQLVGNNINGSDTNLYLKVYSNDKILYKEMTGINSGASFYIDGNRAVYKGDFCNVGYVVILSVVKNKWFFDVTLFGNNEKCEVVYGGGIFLSEGGNEPYTCQYIDTSVFQDENGYSICNRGTINHNFVQIGSFNKTTSYSTDGYQFFGLQYRKTNEIKALKESQLDNEIYQYEFTFSALQSDIIKLNGEENIVFYGAFEKNRAKATKSALECETIKKDFNKNINIDENKLAKVERIISPENVLIAEKLSSAEIDKFYGNKILEEVVLGQTLSFFTDTYEHIVMAEKEVLNERATGHIIFNRNLNYDEPIMASTNYMAGVFNSHIVVGNTNVNKFTTDYRNVLNIFKTSGQRIYIKIDEQYKLLNLPSVYEMGFNYAKWIYKINDDFIKILAYTTDERPEIILEVHSEIGKKYDYIITSEISMGEDERTNEFVIKKIENGVMYLPKENTYLTNKYPFLNYKMLIDKPFVLTDDKVFFKDNITKKEPISVMCIENESSFKITTLGQRDEKEVFPSNITFEDAKTLFVEFINDVLCKFKVRLKNDYINVEKFNAIARWYTHNAFVHYLTPHGLEQNSGAAWGVRDVCQGPTEYFLATQNHKYVRKTLLEIFKHQYIEDGGWPQWFMFDKFNDIGNSHSHGDVAAWPLRSLALYLRATGDTSILSEKICYTHKKDFNFTEKEETILSHIKREVENIKASFIPNTYLSTYGGGDWNDSMCPANKKLANTMASGWTPILHYEGLKYLAKELEDFDSDYSLYLKNLSTNIKNDYEKYILKDNIPAGYILFEKEKIKYIVHPTDKETKLRYRLLPINRGIISSMFDKNTAKNLLCIAEENLYREDGAILYSDCIPYIGGENTYFQRAEQSSNVGREIGLFYVHAHLRYIEALAQFGKAEDAWINLEKPNPILINDKVKNAEPRQSNAYFSSSDANVKNRYDYMEKFTDVAKGKVGVKGGWKIYSSGPGIYVNLLITKLLGINIVKNGLELSPMVNKNFDGLEVDFQYKKQDITFKYSIGGSKIDKIIVNETEVEFKKQFNQYEVETVLIEDEMLKLLLKEKNCITIYFK